MNPQYGDDGTVKVLKCYIYDVKAHTYNLYPNGHKSHEYSKVEVSCESGIVQTGILHPNATNAIELSLKNFDGSIVELCSNGDMVDLIPKEEGIQDLYKCK